MQRLQNVASWRTQAYKPLKAHQQTIKKKTIRSCDQGKGGVYIISVRHVGRDGEFLTVVRRTEGLYHCSSEWFSSVGGGVCRTLISFKSRCSSPCQGQSNSKLSELPFLSLSSPSTIYRLSKVLLTSKQDSARQR